MTTFFDYADRYMTDVLPLKKPASINTITSHLKAHLLPAFGKLELADINYPSTQKFIAELAKSKEPKTVKNIWGTMRLLLTQAQREGLCGGVPTPVLPKNKRHDQEWLTAEQMQTMIDACSHPYDLFCAVLGETGARIGEVLGLQWRDINVRRRTLTFARSVYNGKVQGLKTDNSYREICLSNWMYDWLLSKREKQDAYWLIFHNSRLNPWWPSEAAAVLADTAVLNGIEPVGFHAWRRGTITLCTKVLEMPVAIVAQRVGHAADGMTLGVYAQPVRFADREWVEKIAEAIKP